MSASNAPLEKGGQMPDRMKPVASTQEQIATIKELFGDDFLTWNPYDHTPITSETYAQYAGKKSFEKMKVYTHLVLEQLDGWWMKLAKPRQMEFNQQVQINTYARRPLVMAPENVPPPMWTHKTEYFAFQMDKFIGGFELHGNFFAYGKEAATKLFADYTASLISGAVIALKMKITSTLMRSKQTWWLKHYQREPSSKTILEASAIERESYCSLSWVNKGFPTLCAYARSLASQANFEFDTMVVPYGTLDSIVYKNNYLTEEFRVGGGNAIEFLKMGGRKLKNLISGLEVFEDARWNLQGVPQDEIEAFLHYTMHGGFIYNRGHEDCDEDTDIDCLYGFGYLHAGQRNWATKKLLDLIRENGRFVADGQLHPFHWVLAANWEKYCRQAGVTVYSGLLDPMLYKLESGIINQLGNRTSVFNVANHFGEVDLRYSPFDKLKEHADRMKRYIKRDKRLTDKDIENITQLEDTSKSLTNLEELDPNVQAWLAGIAMNPENRVNGGSASPFLNVNPTTMAPRALYVVESGLTNFDPGYFPNGPQKLMYFFENGVRNYIMIVKLDTASNNGRRRGEPDSPYYFVAIPENDKYFTANSAEAIAAIQAGLGVAANVWGTAGAIGVQGGGTNWALWGTAQLNAAAAIQGSRQGWQAPVFAIAPDRPIGYGGINGLRELASMFKNNQYRGWPKEYLEDVYKGVVSLDKLIKLSLDVYTEMNLFFDATFVPVHMKSEDPVLNRLNSSISSLWGDFYRPFLIRAPLQGAHTAQRWYVPVANNLFDGAVLDNRNEVMLDAIINFLGRQGHQAAGANDAASDATRRAFSVLMESGALSDLAKSTFLKASDIAAFADAYDGSPSAMAYASILKTRTVAPTVNNLTDFWNGEIQPRLDLVNQSLAANDIPATAQQLNVIGKLLSGLVALWKDKEASGNAFQAPITTNWLASIIDDAMGPKTGAVVKSTKGKTDVKIVEDNLNQMTRDGTLRRLLANAAAGNVQENIVARVPTIGRWINTRLMLGNSLWNNIRMRANAALKAGNLAGVFSALSVPVRPMSPGDPTIPLAGDDLPEEMSDNAYVQNTRGLGDALTARQTTAVGNFEYAAAAPVGSEFQLPGLADRPRKGAPAHSVTGGMKTHVRDLEEMATTISNSLYENRRRQVPTEWMTRGTPGERDGYLVPVQQKSDNLQDPTLVTRYTEPHYFKLRMDHIYKKYEGDSLGALFAKLWCGSKIHFKVLESMIKAGIPPYGVGHVQMRPFIRDSTGAVLFGVGSTDVAESGINAPLSYLSLNGPYDKWTVSYSIWLGCAVYQPDKLLWINSQVMRRNVSGLTGEMYVEEGSFDLNQANRPQKSGFMIFVGDNLRTEDIIEPISITSKNNPEKYGRTVADRGTLEAREQHLPGLLYVIAKHGLTNIPVGMWNVRTAFWDMKFGNDINGDCFSETHTLYNPKTGLFDRLIKGNWFYGDITPADMGVLTGSGGIFGKETTIPNFRG